MHATDLKLGGPLTDSACDGMFMYLGSSFHLFTSTAKDDFG